MRTGFAVVLAADPDSASTAHSQQRDPKFVARSPTQVHQDGTKEIILRNINKEHTFNIDPSQLPCVVFGGQNGLQVRAWVEIRIYLRPVRDRNNPLFFDLVGSATADGPISQLWVHGRLQNEGRTIRLASSLIWDEERARYVHRASAG
jgi:hypothetical protein